VLLQRLRPLPPRAEQDSVGARPCAPGKRTPKGHWQRARGARRRLNVSLCVGGRPIRGPWPGRGLPVLGGAEHARRAGAARAPEGAGGAGGAARLQSVGVCVLEERARAREKLLLWGKGTRRVQLVRRDGRDVSTLYGREGGGGGKLLPAVELPLRDRLATRLDAPVRLLELRRALLPPRQLPHRQRLSQLVHVPLRALRRAVRHSVVCHVAEGVLQRGLHLRTKTRRVSRRPGRRGRGRGRGWRAGRDGGGFNRGSVQ
jgi:hypothetical protein